MDTQASQASGPPAAPAAASSSSLPWLHPLQEQMRTPSLQQQPGMHVWSVPQVLGEEPCAGHMGRDAGLPRDLYPTKRGYTWSYPNLSEPQGGAGGSQDSQQVGDLWLNVDSLSHRGSPATGLQVDAAAFPAVPGIQTRARGSGGALQ